MYRCTVSAQGKAGSVAIKWSNVQHILCLSKPDAGSSASAATPHIVVLVLKEPAPFLKGSLPLVCLQMEAKGELKLEWKSTQHCGKPYETLVNVLCAAANKKPIYESKAIFNTPSGKRSVRVFTSHCVDAACSLTHICMCLYSAATLPATKG